VLAAAKVAVVLQCAFVEFLSTIVELFAVVAERLHLIGGERLKVAQDRQIPVEDFHGIGDNGRAMPAFQQGSSVQNFVRFLDAARECASLRPRRWYRP
jgi:hypothetical protein